MKVLLRSTALGVFAHFARVIILLVGITANHGQTYQVIRPFGLFQEATGSAPLWPLVQGVDGALYGTTSGGALTLKGSVFKVQPDGTGFTVLKLFTNVVEGLAPDTSLAVSGGTLYGATSKGGESDAGTLFKVNTDGTGFTVLKNWTNAPSGELAITNGWIYGTADTQIFRVNLDGSDYQVLRASAGDRAPAGVMIAGDFLWGTLLDTIVTADAGRVFRMKLDGSDFTTYTIDCVTEGSRTWCGKDPREAGVLIYDNKIFQPTYNGGLQNQGTLYAKTLNGSTFDNGFFSKYLHVFETPHTSPNSGLTRIGNNLFGTTADDAIYRTDLNGDGFSVLKTFTGDTNGAGLSGRLLALGETLYGVSARGGQHDGGVLYKLNSDGSNFGVLTEFNGTADGNTFYSKLASDGTVLYGTTYVGGSSNSGTIFKIGADRSGYTRLKNFLGPDGQNPQGGVVVVGNALYGTTYFGGASNAGVIFRIGTDGSDYRVLTNLFFATGAYPYGSLVSDGTFLYGTTSTGGVQNAGTIFRIRTTGADYRSLRDLTEPEGQAPFAGLLLTNGVLYGTTLRGGANHFGTVFKMNTDGSGYTVLRHFNQTDGSYPRSALALSDGLLYGTTSQGGINNLGVVFKINPGGGDFAVLRQFTAADGYNPYSGVIAIGNTLYGSTFSGGAQDGGTFYKINVDGSGFSVLTNVAVTTGQHAQGELLLQDGLIYGTTSSGGPASGGVIFVLNPSGKVALTVQSAGSQAILRWPGPGFRLQSAPTVLGVYSDVAAASPYSVPAADRSRFFRLIATGN